MMLRSSHQPIMMAATRIDDRRDGNHQRHLDALTLPGDNHIARPVGKPCETESECQDKGNVNKQADHSD